MAPVYLRRYCGQRWQSWVGRSCDLHQLVCCLFQEQEQLNSPDRDFILLVQVHGTACQSGWGCCLLMRLSRKASKLICLICEFVFRFRQFHIFINIINKHGDPWLTDWLTDWLNEWRFFSESRVIARQTDSRNRDCAASGYWVCVWRQRPFDVCKSSDGGGLRRGRAKRGQSEANGARTETGAGGGVHGTPTTYFHIFIYNNTLNASGKLCVTMHSPMWYSYE